MGLRAAAARFAAAVPTPPPPLRFHRPSRGRGRASKSIHRPRFGLIPATAYRTAAFPSL